MVKLVFKSKGTDIWFSLEIQFISNISMKIKRLEFKIGKEITSENREIESRGLWEWEEGSGWWEHNPGMQWEQSVTSMEQAKMETAVENEKSGIYHYIP